MNDIGICQIGGKDYPGINLFLNIDKMEARGAEFKHTSQWLASLESRPLK